MMALRVMMTVLLATVLGMAGVRSANAIGCISGGVAGAVAGHMAHHGVLGAIGGCVAGHELHKHQKQAAEKQQMQQSQPSSATDQTTPQH